MNHLEKDDFWRVKIKDKRTQELREVGRPIVSHEGVERLARIYGVRVERYTWLKTEPSDLLVMIEVTGGPGDEYNKVTPEVGECATRNAGQIGGNYPHSMAWKRGYDRAVLKHLGIEAYSAEEADDFKLGMRESFGGKRQGASSRQPGKPSSARKPAPQSQQQTAPGSAPPKTQSPAATDAPKADDRVVSFAKKFGARGPGQSAQSAKQQPPEGQSGDERPASRAQVAVLNNLVGMARASDGTFDIGKCLGRFGKERVTDLTLTEAAAVISDLAQAVSV
jgi:hypothetical protein